ncbi:MAG: dual specificity protein phosphatase family protein [Kofleriaceae bacterium]
MLAIGFLLASGVFAALAVLVHWAFWWPAISLFASFIVYCASAPAAFMKRPDGTLPLYSWLLWWPLFVWQWIGHEWVRFLTKEPVANEVAPRLWVGRRPRAGELPANTAVVIDLCAELPAAREVATGRTYLTIPTLDARAPTPEQICEAVDVALANGGLVFVHCAFGHGRSATVAAAIMVRRGDATLDDVEAKMKAARPKIGLNKGQRAALAIASRTP